MEEERIPYRDVCIDKGPEYFDYKNYKPSWE
jgi:hypothetical protein